MTDAALELDKCNVFIDVVYNIIRKLKIVSHNGEPVIINTQCLIANIVRDCPVSTLDMSPLSSGPSGRHLPVIGTP